MALNISIKVLIGRARTTNFVIAILRCPHLLTHQIKFLLMLLDFFADEVALPPILRILCALHEIHGFDLHLLE